MKIVRNNASGATGKLYVGVPEDRCLSISADYDSTNNVIKFGVTSYSSSNVVNYNEVSNTISYSTEETVYQKFSETLNVDSLNVYDCSVFAFVTDSNYVPLKGTQTTQTQVIDILKFTYPAKLNRFDFGSLYNKTVYGALVVPFANSTPDEMIFVVNAGQTSNVSFTHTGFSEELSPISPRINGFGWVSTLPKLSAPAELGVSTNSTTDFNVQLVDNNKNPVLKSNVTIFLETTGGSLSSDRIVTDVNGIATGTVHVGDVPTVFKIKAGFKYYSGLKDIVIKVS